MTKNLGTLDRIGRVVLGGSLVLWALSRVLSASGFIADLAYMALIVLGGDFVVTGIRGYCPLYTKLGWNTAQPSLPSKK